MQKIVEKQEPGREAPENARQRGLARRGKRMVQSEIRPRRRRRGSWESMEIASEFDGGGRGIAFVSPNICIGGRRINFAHGAKPYSKRE